MMFSSKFPIILVLLPFYSQRYLAGSVHLRPLAREQEQSPLGLFDGGHARFRPAEERDADDITTVIYDAFSPGEGAKYVHLPGRGVYRKEEWKCVRKTVKSFLDAPTNRTFLNVITIPRKSGKQEDSEAIALDGPRQKPQDERVVAFGGWSLIEPHQENSSIFTDLGLLNCGFEHKAVPSTQRDTWGSARTDRCEEMPWINHTRANDFGKQMNVAYEKYINSSTTKQMYLAVLATHPDWDGHGFGARHVHWGIRQAMAFGVPSTLIATPAGYPLYDSLGFESVANITINMLDDLGQLWFEYMRYDL